MQMDLTGTRFRVLGHFDATRHTAGKSLGSPCRQDLRQPAQPVTLYFVSRQKYHISPANAAAAATSPKLPAQS